MIVSNTFSTSYRQQLKKLNGQERKYSAAYDMQLLAGILNSANLIEMCSEDNATPTPVCCLCIL